MNKPNYPILSVIAFFVLSFFIFGPGTIYLTNSVEFTNGDFDLFLVGICLSLVFSLVFWLIFLALWAVGPRFLEKGLAILFGVALLIWLQGNFLLWSYGPLDGRYIAWSSLKWNAYIDGSIWIMVLMAVLQADIHWQRRGNFQKIKFSCCAEIKFLRRKYYGG